MAKKRIAVTGGAGFLGSHLCERLLAGEHEVVCLDNFFTGTRKNVEHLLWHPRFELARHDVVQPVVIEVDRIYHLACPASPIHYQKNPVRTIRTAVQGTLNMLDMAREVGARILIASTSEVYGDPQEHPQRETYWGHVNPIGPRACYDEGKRCAQALTVSYKQQYGIETRIARIFNTYGPRMHPNDGRVVSNFIVQALRGEPITIHGEGPADPQLLLRGRHGRRPRPPHEHARRPRPDQLRQPARAHRARAGEDDHRSRRLVLAPPARAPARRRSGAPQARYPEGRRGPLLAPSVPIKEGLTRTIGYFKSIEI